MKHIEYVPSGVCSRMISFDLSDDGRIHNLAFLAGCPGNLRAISKLVEGQDAKRVAEILKGNQCGPRPTSCADQLSKQSRKTSKIKQAIKSLALFCYFIYITIASFTYSFNYF